MPDLGEQAISKVAEVGIASQLDEVENLDVRIQTDPLKVMSGNVNGVSITGEGLVMKQDLRVESMQLETNSISINPLSVAFGKIELTQPTAAEARVVLAEADINRAFNSDFIQAKLQRQTITVNGRPQTIDTRNVTFQLPDDDRFAIQAEVLIHETGETQPIAFTTVPTIGTAGHCIVLEQIEFIPGQNPEPEFTSALIQAASELLDLRNFELEGMSFWLKELHVKPGKLTLRASTTIEQFPAS
jgi:hypothetical protein